MNNKVQFTWIRTILLVPSYRKSYRLFKGSLTPYSADLCIPMCIHWRLLGNSPGYLVEKVGVVGSSVIIFGIETFGILGKVTTFRLAFH